MLKEFEAPRPKSTLDFTGKYIWCEDKKREIMTLFPDGSVDFSFGNGKNWENHGKGLITFYRNEDKITAEFLDCGMKLKVCYP